MNAQDKEGCIGGLIGIIIIGGITFLVISGIISDPISKAKQEGRQEEDQKIVLLDKLLQEARTHFGELAYDKALLSLAQSEQEFKLHPKHQEWRSLHQLLVKEVYAKAQYLYQEKNYKGASQHFQTFIQYNTEKWADRQQVEQMIDAFHQAGDDGFALQLLDAFIASNPASYDLLLNKATIHKDNGNYQEALASLERAVEHITKDYISRHGQAYALVIDPSNYDWPSYHYDIFCEKALICLALGDFKKASSSYEWAQFIRPDKGRAYYLEAVGHQKSGNMNKACRLLRKARRLGWKGEKTVFNC